jgi:aminoglycoside phosphotransferase (APT) family kinase protein
VDDGPANAEWAPEHAVSQREAADLIGGQFAELRGAPVRALATGWDNTVFLVGGRWVFRFPRRAIALPGVRREIAALPRLAPRLPLAVPVPELVGRPSGGYPWPFWGARLIPGAELAESGVPGSARVAAATGLGEFLRALHDPRLVPLNGTELPGDPMRRAEPAVRAPRARERLARLARAGAWRPDPRFERLFGEGERLGPPAGALVVVHGDLHVRHLLVDTGARAAGVIDWGDLCLADPAVDLSLAYAGFAGPARTALLSAYGPVDAEREVRARVLAVELCAILADYAAATRRERLLAETLAGIGRAVA